MIRHLANKLNTLSILQQQGVPKEETILYQKFRKGGLDGSHDGKRNCRRQSRPPIGQKGRAKRCSTEQQELVLKGIIQENFTYIMNLLVLEIHNNQLQSQNQLIVTQIQVQLEKAPQ
eukprot:TRINITY_DN37858_c0_g2_i1.p4 TRINITY_DN37858_c0_g2~~TRINITY_DN37858_c0_g2_i1.p4  ORF type:complete len:117 (+),score=8.28 TRINITY_DN37858_c0_g2_i1:78-428(+)